jgi:endonuclease/exonuclease/phosphatase family metal-dependent hydrolase
MPSLTVATINLRLGLDRWAARRHLLVAQLVDAAPDLISLQEISMPLSQGRWLRDQINARLATRGEERPYRLIQKRKQDPLKGYLEGIGVLSRLPPLYHDAVSLGYGGRVALRVTVELPSRQPLDFVSVHLHHEQQDKEAREEQVLRMVGWLSSRQRLPLQVVAGDFNELPNGPAIQTMKQTYRSAYELAYGYEPLATFPTALVPSLDGWSGCLDYIFVSSAVTVSAARIFCDQPADDDDTLYPSDHVGLIATLEV